MQRNQLAAETIPFSTVPDDILLETMVPFLTHKERQELSLVNKNFYQLLQPQLKVDQLLQQVARGEQEQAEALLKKNATLLFAKGTVSDYSGRVFENITAFQLALWSLDRHMWQMLLNYLPPEEAARQLQEHEDESNKPGYVKIHGKHYDFSPLTTALQAYVVYWALQNAPTFTMDRVAELWLQVGSAQQNSPAHVLQEYCCPHRPLYPTPTFKEAYLPRTLKFHYCNNNSYPSLFNQRSNLVLGVDFSLYRDGRIEQFYYANASSSAQGSTNAIPPAKVAHDLAAMTSLADVRTQEFAALKELLFNTAPNKTAQP